MLSQTKSMLLVVAALLILAAESLQANQANPRTVNNDNSNNSNRHNHQAAAASQQQRQPQAQAESLISETTRSQVKPEQESDLLPAAAEEPAEASESYESATDEEQPGSSSGDEGYTSSLDYTSDIDAQPPIANTQLRPSRQSEPNRLVVATRATTTHSQPTASGQNDESQQHSASNLSGRAPATEPNFNVNMGADRIFIKAQPQLHQPTTTISTAATTMATNSAADDEVVSPAAGVNFLSTNERRQDLLYPSASSTADELARLPSIEVQRFTQQLHPHPQPQLPDADLTSASQANICYTPLALLMVILVTMTITVGVCLCTHALIRQLGKRQFDLVASGKQFDWKHDGGSKQQQQLFAAARAGKQNVAAATNHLFRADRACAFDNPYFRDERTVFQSELPASSPRGREQGHQFAPMALPVAPTGSEQLHFIDHHISKLHSRQVTSSVKELSILGAASESPTSPPVVDLTSAEQRAKVLENPKEGDLVSVDLSGHDFIGLGFDLCGGQQDGIFVNSVLNRGPARESGCIQAGDRIRCINIGFDGMTLQDANDILNCGSPYRLRLLLEKRPLAANRLDKLRKSPPTPYFAPALQTGKQSVARSASYQPTSEHSQDLNNHSSSPAGHLKSYIRRLTSLVSPTGSGSSSKSLANSMSEHQLVGPAYLGSSAARQQWHQAHINAGYGSESDELNVGARCSLEESVADLVNGQTGSTTFATDSSLDYPPTHHHQNINFHGPQLDLRLSAQANEDDADGRYDNGEREEEQRRKSLGNNAKGLRKNGQEQQLQASLEQTQSQPEIASDAIELQTGAGQRQTRTVSNSAPSVVDLMGRQQRQADRRRVSSRRNKTAEPPKAGIISEESSSMSNGDGLVIAVEQSGGAANDQTILESSSASSPSTGTAKAAGNNESHDDGDNHHNHPAHHSSQERRKPDRAESFGGRIE